MTRHDDATLPPAAPRRAFAGFGAFVLEDRLLALQAPAIAAQAAILAHRPVARYQDRNRIRGAGAAHGALASTTPGDTSMATRKEVEKTIAGGGARVVR